MWPIPQIFDWGLYNISKHESRPPTLQEMKCMSWQALVAGGR